MTMIFYTIPAVTAFAPDFPLFDLLPMGYSFNYANELLSSLDIEGRNLYLSMQLPLDFFYPGLFIITYSLLLVWLFRKIGYENYKMYYFIMIPFLAGIFDYIENIFIIIMINSFPDLSINVVKLANISTIFKSIFTSIFFILLIIVFIIFLKQKFTHKKEV
jgi:hypothetical protein